MTRKFYAILVALKILIPKNIWWDGFYINMRNPCTWLFLLISFFYFIVSQTVKNSILIIFFVIKNSIDFWKIAKREFKF